MADSRSASILGELAFLLKPLLKVMVVAYGSFFLALTLIHFPYDTDPSDAEVAQSQKKSAAYYQVAYKPIPGSVQPLDYEQTAKAAAVSSDVQGKVRRFIADYSLADKRALEVGSGAGTLQDLVDDYTGLDISTSVAPKYHKPFVAASATKMPFPDNTFDAIWSIWVLEHIRQPEHALKEMRRVLRPGGVIFLMPTFFCDSWLAEGYQVRPYSDFDWKGKLVKASLAIRTKPLFVLAHITGVRATRLVQYWAGLDTHFRFRALNPNYEIYWQPDSDAAVYLDGFEMSLWFRKHGDQCLNCSSPAGDLFSYPPYLVFRVNKPQLWREATSTPDPAPTLTATSR